jgi:tetratricopeptide (TPR) repeat protein
VTKRSQADTVARPVGQQGQELALHQAVGSAGLLAVLVLAAYARTLGAGFIWDDDAHTIGPGLASLRGLARIWFRPGATQQYYPVTYTFFWLENAAWGHAAFCYHAFNLALHASVCVLLLLLLRRIGAPGALFAAALFAVHPVCAETVSWVSEEKNTLSALFTLGAALAYSGFDADRRPARYAGATGLFLLALLSKTVAATLPAAILVLLWWKRGRLAWKRDAAPLLPWIALGALAGCLTAWMEATKVGASGGAFTLGPGARLIVAGRALWFYLGKLALPIGLTFIYPRWSVDASDVWQYAWPAGAAAALAGLWLLRGRSRGPLAVGLLFAGTLVPALGFVNVFPFLYSFVADHFQYPAAAAVISGVAGALALASSRLAAFTRSAGAACVIAPLLVLTSRQTAAYHDDETLWTATLENNPGAWMAYNNLAADVLARGDADKALAYAQHSLSINPQNAQGHLTMGDVLLMQSRPKEAFAEYGRALELEPNSPIAQNNVANALMQSGRNAEAIEHYEAAIRSKPDYAKAHANLGVAYIRAKRPDAAVAELERAIELDPADAGAEANLGVVFIQKGDVPSAITHFRRATEIDPTFVAAQTNLGNALMQSGRPSEAIAPYARAAQLEPRLPAAWDALGVCLLRAGRPVDAADQFRQALAIDPSDRRAAAGLEAVSSAAPK